MKTVFCDVDGVIFEHPENFLDLYKKVLINPIGNLIPGSKEKILDWYCLGYRIIFTTGRPASEYDIIHKALTNNGVYFHKLIMECGADQRFVINDIDPVKSGRDKAFGINIKRNDGLKNVEIPKD